MTPRLLRTAVVYSGMFCLPLVAALALSGPLAAQVQRSRPVAPVADDPDELSPRQMQQAPAAKSDRVRTPPAQPAPQPAAQPAAQPAEAAATPAARPPAPRPTQPAIRSIACNGVFGRDSTHLKLAIAFNANNITFTEVDGPEGTKLNASVVYPNDPKRRLEVLWQNDATRSDTALIVIGGQSQWIAPKGLHIGTPLAALEKANGKPFKLSGLDQTSGGSVLDWNGGAMTSLPGGCSIGVRLAPDAKVQETARAAVAGAELVSNDPALKAARMNITEIILGYSQ